MPNVDIIQLQTICYDIKIDLGYPNFFILCQSHQAHMFHPNTTDHTITNRTVIGRITHYSLSLSFTINEISFTLQFLISNSVS